MPFITADRVKETSTTTGTGNYTLAGAAANFRAFSAVCANGDTVNYAAVDTNGAGWEVGLGTWSTGNTLARTTIYASSNGGAAVNWSAGTRDVFLTAAATFLASRAASGANSDITSLSGLTTALSVAQGGTGATALTANNVILGNGTSAVQFVAPGANGNVLTSNGTTWVSQAGGGGGGLTGVTQSTTPFETSLGFDAGLNTTGVNNTFIGYQAGRANTTGTDNTAVGYQALTAATTTNRNVAVGNVALSSVNSGSSNVAMGVSALRDLTGGQSNVAIGDSALKSSQSGGRNIAIGPSAMADGTASNPSGNNIAIGQEALRFLAGGQWNIAVGAFSAVNITSGENNIAIGNSAADAITTGLNNIGIGQNALGAVTTGSNNVAVGNNAGNATTTGSNQIILGDGANASSATVSNEITLGNSSITKFRVPGVGFQFDTTDGMVVPKTITAAGTTGAQTINRTAGSVNFAAAATSLVVTNSFVSTTSVILATVATNDSTMKSVAAVAASGSFTLHANAAPTAETRVNWIVVN